MSVICKSFQEALTYGKSIIQPDKYQGRGKVRVHVVRCSFDTAKDIYLDLYDTNCQLVDHYGVVEYDEKKVQARLLGYISPFNLKNNDNVYYVLKTSSIRVPRDIFRSQVPPSSPSISESLPITSVIGQFPRHCYGVAQLYTSYDIPSDYLASYMSLNIEQARTLIDQRLGLLMDPKQTMDFTMAANDVNSFIMFRLAMTRQRNDELFNKWLEKEQATAFRRFEYTLRKSDIIEMKFWNSLTHTTAYIADNEELRILYSHLQHLTKNQRIVFTPPCIVVCPFEECLGLVRKRKCILYHGNVYITLYDWLTEVFRRWWKQVVSIATSIRDVSIKLRLRIDERRREIERYIIRQCQIPFLGVSHRSGLSIHRFNDIEDLILYTPPCISGIMQSLRENANQDGGKTRAITLGMFGVANGLNQEQVLSVCPRKDTTRGKQLRCLISDIYKKKKNSTQWQAKSCLTMKREKMCPIGCGFCMKNDREFAYNPSQVFQRVVASLKNSSNSNNNNNEMKIE